MNRRTVTRAVSFSKEANLAALIVLALPLPPPTLPFAPPCFVSGCTASYAALRREISLAAALRSDRARSGSRRSRPARATIDDYQDGAITPRARPCDVTERAELRPKQRPCSGIARAQSSPPCCTCGAAAVSPCASSIPVAFLVLEWLRRTGRHVIPVREAVVRETAKLFLSRKRTARRMMLTSPNGAAQSIGHSISCLSRFARPLSLALIGVAAPPRSGKLEAYRPTQSVSRVVTAECHSMYRMSSGHPANTRSSTRAAASAPKSGAIPTSGAIWSRCDRRRFQPAIRPRRGGRASGENPALMGPKPIVSVADAPAGAEGLKPNGLT